MANGRNRRRHAPMSGRSVEVGGARPYRIDIGTDLLRDGALLARPLRGRHALVVSDDNVAPLYLQRTVDALRAARPDIHLASPPIPAGQIGSAAGRDRV